MYNAAPCDTSLVDGVWNGRTNRSWRAQIGGGMGKHQCVGALAAVCVLLCVSTTHCASNLSVLFPAPGADGTAVVAFGYPLHIVVQSTLLLEDGPPLSLHLWLNELHLVTPAAPVDPSIGITAATISNLSQESPPFHGTHPAVADLTVALLPALSNAPTIADVQYALIEHRRFGNGSLPNTLASRVGMSLAFVERGDLHSQPFTDQCNTSMFKVFVVEPDTAAWPPDPAMLFHSGLSIRNQRGQMCSSTTHYQKASVCGGAMAPLISCSHVSTLSLLCSFSCWLPSPAHAGLRVTRGKHVYLCPV